MVNVSFFLQNIGYMLNRTMMIIIGNWEVQETEEFICHFDSNLPQDSSIEHGLLRPLDVSRRTDTPSDRVSGEWSQCEPFNSTGLHSRRLENEGPGVFGKALSKAYHRRWARAETVRIS